MALGYGRVATNQFGCSKFIVDTNGLDKGATHTTIAASLADASSGDTIFIKPGTYTENLTLVAGVNLTAFESDMFGQVTIVGKLTATFAGTTVISGIRLQTNSDNFLVVSGTNATIVYLINCYLNCTNNTGISHTSSDSASFLYFYWCRGDITTTGITLFSSTSAAPFIMRDTFIWNNGASTTASTKSASFIDAEKCKFRFPITFSGTAGLALDFCSLETNEVNTTPIVAGGSGGVHTLTHCTLAGGTSPALTVTSQLEICECVFQSTNTNVIDGAGTLTYHGIANRNSGAISTTTQVANQFFPGITRSSHQPAFSAYNSVTDTNITGNGAIYTIIPDTEVFDQNSDYNNATGVFTAPYTGRYSISNVLTMQQVTSSMTASLIKIVTSNRTYETFYADTNAWTVGNSVFSMTSHVLADMDASDTFYVTIQVSGGAGDTADLVGSGASYRTGTMCWLQG